MEHTLREFGERKFEEYQELIRDALDAIKRDPADFAARARADLGTDLFTFHIARRGKPARHLLIYHTNPEVTQVSRLPHDSMDLRKHIGE